MPHRSGNDVIRGEQLVEAFLRKFLHLKLRGQIITHPRAQTCRRLVAPLLHHVGKRLSALGEFSVLGRRELHEPIIAAVKHAIERVVILVGIGSYLWS